MNTTLVSAVFLTWVPLVAILFRVVGPRRAVLLALLGGQLFLPSGQVDLGPAPFSFPATKVSMTGLGLILGALIFDPRSLLRARPGWLDLPMLLYCLSPLVGLATGIPGSGADIRDELIYRGLGWFVPYLMGRVYFGRGDGPPAIVVALTIAGLSYIPVCLYEEAAGPSNYLSVLIFRAPVVVAAHVERLGGWRPVGFLNNGVELAAWMALTTVMATWLWLGGGRLGRWPAWAPAAALLAATISCRGVYGYLLMAAGLASATLTRRLRSRAVLVALLVLPAAYMVLRGSGLWDGAILIRGAGLTGRAGTVAFRIEAEDELIRRVAAQSLAFGFGTHVQHAVLSRWPDGNWLQALWMGGLVGLAAQLSALYVIPATLALSRPRGRPDRRQAASPAWGLSAWCLLAMIDGIHNTNYFTATALVAGTLVAAYLSGEAGGFGLRAADRGRVGRRNDAPWPLIVTVILLVVVEALGRRHEADTPHPDPPAPDRGPRTNPP